MAPINKPVKINVDLGEGYGNFKCGPDSELIPLIDHANIACGGHAGDPLIMAQSVRACKEHNIAAGAHPGLPDVQGFGRRAMVLDPEEAEAIVRYQIGALKGFLDAEGVALHHVKPHGALYGMCYKDRELCRGVYRAVPKGVKVFGLAGTLHEEVAKEMGLEFVAELYGDKKYNADKTLQIDRKASPWAPEDVKKHIMNQLENSAVTAATGEEVELPVGDHEISMCCHSDTPGALDIVTAARQMVDEFNKRFK